MATKRKKRPRRVSPLMLLAPFLVDWWCAHRDVWTFAKLWWLWDALDEDDERRRDGGD